MTFMNFVRWCKSPKFYFFLKSLHSKNARKQYCEPLTSPQLSLSRRSRIVSSPRHCGKSVTWITDRTRVEALRESRLTFTDDLGKGRTEMASSNLGRRKSSLNAR